MKKLTVFTLVLSTILSNAVSAQFTDSTALAKVPAINNKLVFYHCNPTTEYQQVFTFDNIIENYTCNSPQQNMAASVYNANIEAAKQGEFYDAIIVMPGNPRDIAVVFTDKNATNNIAEVNKVDGLFMFVGMEPIKPYKVSYKRQTGKAKLFCPDNSRRVAELMKFAEKQNAGEYNAIYITNTLNDLLIKF